MSCLHASAALLSPHSCGDQGRWGCVLIFTSIMDRHAIVAPGPLPRPRGPWAWAQDGLRRHLNGRSIQVADGHVASVAPRHRRHLRSHIGSSIAEATQRPLLRASPLFNGRRMLSSGGASQPAGRRTLSIGGASSPLGARVGRNGSRAGLRAPAVSDRGPEPAFQSTSLGHGVG